MIKIERNEMKGIFNVLQEVIHDLYQLVSAVAHLHDNDILHRYGRFSPTTVVSSRSNADQQEMSHTGCLGRTA